MKGKIVVTGGTGYIGSHTAVELINKGYEVVIIDNLSNSKASVIDSIEKICGTRPKFYEMDLLNQAKLNDFFAENKDLAAKVLEWTLNNMQNKKGYFYYQLKKGVSSKISYMRWSNAFMFNAFSYYLKEIN